MEKQTKMAVIAEDVKKVEKKIKFSEIYGNLGKLVDDFEREFKKTSDSLESLGLFLKHFETDENIANIDFIDCNEDTEEEFDSLIDVMKKAFFICPYHLELFEDFWAKIDKISVNLWRSNERAAKSVYLADMEAL